MWIQETQKHADPSDPDPEPWTLVHKNIFVYGAITFYVQGRVICSIKLGDCPLPRLAANLMANFILSWTSGRDRTKSTSLRNDGEKDKRHE